MKDKSQLATSTVQEGLPDSGLTDIGKSLTSSESSLTETETSNTAGQNSNNEGVIENKVGKKGGRPHKLISSTAVTWSVRGVERETRAIIEKAAERAGKTLGQYLNDEIRSLVQSQLTQSEAIGQTVASPRDLQNQVEQLTQIVEGIAARLAEPERKGFWQRVFGK